MSTKTTAELLAELHEKLELAKEPGGEKAAAKRDKKGIPSARARIHALLDPGSFLEIGALCRTPGDPNALYGDGVVTGHGTINGRPSACSPTTKRYSAARSEKCSAARSLT
ncbi:carboxyl transferase domain protein [Mycobacterium xenopi 3993]|nr:carboxyl transferase domain protein [Mycobacterium xenopi 3993]